MRVFKDRNGKDWPVDVDLATVTRVKAETGVQLIDLVLGNSARTLAEDYEAIGALLWSVNAPEATKRGVTPEQFPTLLDGTAIDNAMTAIAEAVADFLPPGRRELAVKVTNKGRELVTKATAAASAKVDLIDADRIVAQMTRDPKAIDSSGGDTISAASPASTPAT